MRLSIGGGSQRYSNCINMDLTKCKDTDIDIQGNATALPFKDKSFTEVLLIHVIEHIERKFHMIVLQEIWRVLKENGRLIMDFPDTIEAMKRFIENRYGRRWETYHWVIFGRQAYPGDYHVSAMERNDITDKLISCGFINIKYQVKQMNVSTVSYKGEKLNYL